MLKKVDSRDILIKGNYSDNIYYYTINAFLNSINMNNLYIYNIIDGIVKYSCELDNVKKNLYDGINWSSQALNFFSNIIEPIERI